MRHPNNPSERITIMAKAAKKIPPRLNATAAPQSGPHVVYSGSSEADMADVIAGKTDSLLLIVPHRNSEIVVGGVTYPANSRAVIPAVDVGNVKITTGSATVVAIPGASAEGLSPITVPDVGAGDIADGITGSTLLDAPKVEMLHAVASTTIPGSAISGALVGVISGALYSADSDNSPSAHTPPGVFFRPASDKKFFTKDDDCTLLLIQAAE